MYRHGMGGEGRGVREKVNSGRERGNKCSSATLLERLCVAVGGLHKVSVQGSSDDDSGEAE